MGSLVTNKSICSSATHVCWESVNVCVLLTMGKEYDMRNLITVYTVLQKWLCCVCHLDLASWGGTECWNLIVNSPETKCSCVLKGSIMLMLPVSQSVLLQTCSRFLKERDYFGACLLLLLGLHVQI